MSSRWTEAEYHAYLDRQNTHGKNPVDSISVSQDCLEDDLLADILKVARLHGWSPYHTRDSRRSEKGFPDLVLTNGHSLIFAELKTRTGKVSEDQARWLSLLEHTGLVETYLWRPADMPKIIERLTRQ